MNSSMGPRVLLAVTDPVSLHLMRGFPAYLSARGWDVHIVVGGTGSVVGATVHVVPMRREPSPLHDAVALVRWVRVCMKLRPDVLMVSTPKAGLLGTMAGTVSRVSARIYLLRGLRLETVSKPLRFLLLWLERVTVFLSSEVLCVSESLRDSARRLELGSPDKFSVIGAGSSNGVDLTRFRARDESTSPPASSRTRPFTVGFVGRITADKGLLTLVKALGLMEPGHVRLVVVGAEESPEYWRECVRELSRHGTEYQWLGSVPDMATVYADFDVLCLPSLREGFPNVVLEAAASSLPAVVADSTGCRDAVVDGQTGLVVSVDDELQLAGALARLSKDRALVEALGKAARARAESHFSQDVVWAGYERRLRNAAGLHVSRPATGQDRTGEGAA